MRTIFISASGTDVGKTFVCRKLITELQQTDYRIRVLKPLASGFDRQAAASTDSGLLLAAQGLPLTDEQLDGISPWRYAAPLSPDMAAAQENKAIEFEPLLNFCRAPKDVDLTLIEGIGGVMVPIDERHTVLDWIAALRAPVLLVVGSYLGTFSHSLTALGMLRARGIRVLSLIVSESPEQAVELQETRRVLQRFVAPTPVLALPRALDDASASPSLLPLISTYLEE